MKDVEKRRAEVPEGVEETKSGAYFEHMTLFPCGRQFMSHRRQGWVS